MPFFLVLPSTLSSFLLPTSDTYILSVSMCYFVCVIVVLIKSGCLESSLLITSLILQEVLWLSERRNQFDVLSFVFVELSPLCPSREDVSLTLLAFPDVCPAAGLCYLLGFLALISNQMHFWALRLPQAPASKGLLLASSGSHGQTHRSLWVWKLAHVSEIHELDARDCICLPGFRSPEEEILLLKRPKFMVLKLWACIQRIDEARIFIINGW